MVQILPQTSWLEFRGAPKGKTFNAGALHFAIIQGTDGKERKCAVKLIDLKTRPGLLCEGLGWMLAQHAGVNVPTFAAVLRVPLAKLGQYTALPSFVNGYTEYPAWCVEVVEGRTPLQIHSWLFWLERASCLKAKNTPVIASFDYWADNRDRNFGNVVRAKDGRYFAIDHETLLHDVIWLKFGVKFELRSLLVEAETQLSQEQLHKFKCEMALAAKHHEGALRAFNLAGKKYVGALIPDQLAAAQLWDEIEGFLAIRAQVGWMSSELRVIV